MKKIFKPVSCSLVAIFALSIAVASPKVGPFGVDTVSAASETAPSSTPPKTTTKTPTKSTTKSTTKTTYRTSSSVTRTLAYNSMGGDVKTLQTSLNNKGYKLDVDGIFGKLTLAAVKNYQGKNGLDVDGIVGQATLAKLNPAPATTATSILGLGSTGASVKTLQTNLNSKGYKLTVDGIFGELTLNAVKNYQGKNSLAVDGLVGPNTLGKLNAKPATAPVVKPPVVVTPPVVVVPPVDTVAAASLVSDVAGFEKAISKDGKWIITTTGDLTTTKNLVLDGEFVNTKTPPVTQRKIGLYTQEKVDGKNVVTARFTLTAPKLTIKSPNASLEHGTFKGDLYVSAPNFKLIDLKVEGNVYFTTQEAKDTFKPLDATSSITGSSILTELDAVTTASIVRTATDFEKAISINGKWIAAILNDITTTKELVLDGAFMNNKTPAVSQRKIALYSQDDKKVTTRKFTLTAPKLTIKSPDASIQKGTFKGDVYVSAPRFSLVDARIEGNVYFTTQEAKDTFKALDATSVITGVQELKTN